MCAWQTRNEDTKSSYCIDMISLPALKTQLAEDQRPDMKADLEEIPSYSLIQMSWFAAREDFLERD